MSASAPVIVAVSDSTGETAEGAGRAALAQFGHHEDGGVRVIPNVRTLETLEDAVKVARDAGALLVYTLVESELRGAIRDLARAHHVRAFDLIGGLIQGLAGHLGQAPLSVPGLSHELDDEYFRRVAAIEFAVKHDDGKNPQNLAQADIVLVGISRASKTPLSNYIAGRGYRVANVPIVMGVPLPRQIDEVDPQRVFALVIDPVVLMKIRQARIASLNMRADSDYGDLRQIRREMSHAKRLLAEHPAWTVIDMSRRAVEEAAAVILEAWRRRFESGTGGAAPTAAQETAPRATAKRKTAKRKTAERKPSARSAAPQKAAKKKAAKKQAAARRAPSRRTNR